MGVQSIYGQDFHKMHALLRGSNNLLTEDNMLTLGGIFHCIQILIEQLCEIQWSP